MFTAPRSRSFQQSLALFVLGTSLFVLGATASETVDGVKSQFSDVVTKYTEKPPLEKAGDTLSVKISTDPKKSDITPKINESNGAETYTLFQSGASFLSLHFKSVNLPRGCKIVTSDKDGKQKDTLRKQGEPRHEGTFWSTPVFSDTVKLELYCYDSEDTKKASFEIDQYSAGYSSTYSRMNRSICGQDNKENAICYKDSESTVYERAKAVARLLFPKNGGWYVCTGWLASSTNLLLTNNHCLGTETEVQDAYFYFMREESQCGVDSSGDPGVLYRASSLLATDATLDYSLIQMIGSPAQNYGYLEIDTERQFVTNERIYIPQHPGGRPKEIAIFDDQDLDGFCRVGFYWYSNTALFYNCDTEGGSSGSPVLAWDNNKVVGLHKWGGCENGGASMYEVWEQIDQFFTTTSEAPTVSTTSSTSGPTCSDSPLLFKVNINGSKQWKTCDWAASDAQNCSYEGVSGTCPAACGTCSTCADSPLKFTVDINGTNKNKRCGWAGRNPSRNCAFDGVAETCRSTCDAC